MTIDAQLRGADLLPITLGESGACVWRVVAAGAPDRFLKRSSGVLADDIRDETARMRWAAGRLPVPQVLGSEDDGTMATLLMSALPGICASDIVAQALLPPATVARMLADALRLLHSTPLGDCPFDHTPHTTLARAAARARMGLIDTDDFDTERTGWTAQQVLDALHATMPAVSDVVLTHGDYCLPNILFVGETLSGFVDLGRLGRGDRWGDLALARRSLEHNDIGVVSDTVPRPL